MEVCLLDVYQPGDNRDYNGGYGTTFQVGEGLLAKLLSFARSKHEYIPLLNYGYISAALKRNGHKVSLGINSFDKDSDLIILQASLIRHN